MKLVVLDLGVESKPKKLMSIVGIERKSLEMVFDFFLVQGDSRIVAPVCGNRVVDEKGPEMKMGMLLNFYIPDNGWYF